MIVPQCFKVFLTFFSYVAAALSELQAETIRLLHRECLGRWRLCRSTFDSGEQARVAVILETYLKYCLHIVFIRLLEFDLNEA